MAQIKPGKFCPLIGEDCIELKCAWYNQVRGVNPQTGQEIDEWGCAVTWMPMLLIENSQMQRQTGAAVESFRNETVKVNQQAQQLFVNALNQQKPINTINPSITQ
tara:strand:+ start:508 stop:822 length:315 start_codon:yes stop_codon:yes gene_type:complete